MSVKHRRKHRRYTIPQKYYFNTLAERIPEIVESMVDSIKWLCKSVIRQIEEYENGNTQNNIDRK